MGLDLLGPFHRIHLSLGNGNRDGVALEGSPVLLTQFTADVQCFKRIANRKFELVGNRYRWVGKIDRDFSLFMFSLVINSAFDWKGFDWESAVRRLCVDALRRRFVSKVASPSMAECWVNRFNQAWWGLREWVRFQELSWRTVLIAQCLGPIRLRTQVWLNRLQRTNKGTGADVSRGFDRWLLAIIMSYKLQLLFEFDCSLVLSECRLQENIARFH